MSTDTPLTNAVWRDTIGRAADLRYQQSCEFERKVSALSASRACVPVTEAMLVAGRQQQHLCAEQKLSNSYMLIRVFTAMFEASAAPEPAGERGLGVRDIHHDKTGAVLSGCVVRATIQLEKK